MWLLSKSALIDYVVINALFSFIWTEKYFSGDTDAIVFWTSSCVDVFFISSGKITNLRPMLKMSEANKAETHQSIARCYGKFMESLWKVR